MKFSIVFLLAFLLTSIVSKEKIIGNTNTYNLKVIVVIDPTKRTEEISYSHIITEKINFRNKTRILKTEIINIPANRNFQNFLTFVLGIWEDELNTKIDYYN